MVKTEVKRILSLCMSAINRKEIRIAFFTFGIVMQFLSLTVLHQVNTSTSSGWASYGIISLILLLIGAGTDNRLYTGKRVGIFTGILFLIIGVLVNVNVGISYAVSFYLFATYFILQNTRVSDRLFGSAFIISCINILFILYWFFSPSLHQANWLCQLMTIVLSLFGFSVQVNDGIMSFANNFQSYSFAISYEQSGFWVMLVTTICVTIYLKFMSKKTKWKLFTISIFFAASLCYFLIRYLIMILAFSFYKDIALFYNPYIVAFTFLPYSAFMVVFAKRRIQNKQEKDTKDEKCHHTNRSTVLLAIGLGSVIMFLIMSVGINIGIPKYGKVYIDEYHSTGWETVYEPLDRKNYGGQKSTYTYTSLVDMLSKVYEVEIIDDIEDYSKITPEDVLIIKTPRADFEESVISLIYDFVDAGGGLWAIGDHTNLFGMSQRFNKLLEKYNISFEYDSVYHLQTANLTVYNRNIMPLFHHEVVSNVDRYKFSTSSSIRSSMLSSKIMIANNAASELLDLSHPNFFGDLSLAETEYFGLFEQCVSMRSGGGRIVAYSDSTTLSGFSINMYSNPQFVLSIVNYLMHKNSVNIMLLLAIATLILLITIIIRKRKHIDFDNLIMLTIIILPLFIFSASSIQKLFNHTNVTSTEHQLNEIDTVYFYSEPDNELIPHFSSGGTEPNLYSSMFVSFQRSGYFPREVYSLTECVQDNAELIVILNISSLTQEDLRQLSHFINAGGKVLLCTYESLSPREKEALYSFGIEYAVNDIEVRIENPENTENDQNTLLQRIYVPINQDYSDTYYVDKVTNIRVDRHDVGKGSYYVLFGSTFFDNAGMGSTMVIPYSTQIARHDLFYAIMDYVMGNLQ